MPRSRGQARILVLAGSVRSGSYSTALAALAVHMLAVRGVDVTRISLADHPLPIYDADLEARSGVPEEARRLHGLFTSHGGIYLATPEYNASVPPLLKNALDWTSRVRPASPSAPDAWKGRVFAVGSTSPGPFGGLRALMHLRQVLELGLGALVLPEQVAIGNAASAFAPDGGLVDERHAGRLAACLDRLVDEAARYAPD